MNREKLDMMPSTYPDKQYIRALHQQFLRRGINNMMLCDVVDLINHQNELICELKRQIELTEEMNK